MELLVVVVVIAIAAAARLVMLDRVPPPMNQDEVGRAYDAWCIWRTGADQHGDRWPVLLRQFGPGDYSGALDAYLIAPFIGLLGPTVVAARLPMALVGTLSVAVLWWWVRREFDATAAIVAAAMLALSPCHVHHSRLALDVLLVPAMLTAGLAMLSAAGFRFRGQSEAPLRWLVMFISGVTFGAAIYSFIAVRLALPVMLIALLLTFPVRLKRLMADPRSRFAVAAFVLGLFLASSPFLRTFLRHPEQVFGRAAYASVFSQPEGDRSRIVTVIGNYLLHFDPRFLFISGETSPGNARCLLGMLHWYELALVPIGLVCAARAAPKNGMAKWCLVWLAIAPLPAAFSVGGLPHAFRANGMLPPLVIMSGLAVAEACRLLAKVRRSVSGIIFGAALCMAAFTELLNAQTYFVRMPKDLGMFYQMDLAKAFNYLREAGCSYDHYVVTKYANQAYIYLLYFGRIPPEEYHRAHMVRKEWFAGFDAVLRVNEYYFGDQPQWGEELEIGERFTANLKRLARDWPDGQRVLLIVRPGQTRLGELIHTIDTPDLTPVLELREVRTDWLR